MRRSPDIDPLPIDVLHLLKAVLHKHALHVLIIRLLVSWISFEVNQAQLVQQLRKVLKEGTDASFTVCNQNRKLGANPRFQLVDSRHGTCVPTPTKANNRCVSRGFDNARNF